MLNAHDRNVVFAAAFAGAVLLSSAVPALAVDFKLDRRSSDGDKVKVCVGLDSRGASVAGTQNDLVFDESCASLTQADCAASEHHGKPLHGSIPANETSTFRSLVFALDNVDPMKDGDVYCCDFTLRGSGDGCCAVEMTRLGVSDPQGVSLDFQAVPAKLCLTGEGQPAPAAAAVSEQAPAPQAPAEGANWRWVVLLGVAVLAVLFFALRRAS